MNILKDSTIKHRLLLLAILFTSALAGISIYIFIGLQKVTDIKEYVLAVKDLQQTMLEMRKAEKDFIIRDFNNPKFYKTGETKNLKKVDKALESLESQIENLRNNEITQELNLQNEYKDLNTSVNSYDTKITDYVAAKKERGFKNYGLVGEMRQAIHKLERAIKNHYSDKSVEVYILKMRKHEKDYLIRMDIGYVEKLHKTVAACKQYMLSEYKNSTTVQDDLVLLDQYQTTFQNIIDLDNEIGYTESTGIRGEFRQAIHQIAPLVDTLSSTSIKEGENIADNTRATIFWISIFFLLAIVIITYYIITGINRSLTEANKIVNQLAKGNFTVKIKKSSNDEIGVLLANIKIMVEKLRTVLLSVREISGNIGVGSNEIKHTSKQLSNSSQFISQGASEQAASTEEISSSMSEMMASVQQSTENAEKTEKIADEAAQNILEGNTNVSATLEAMRKIVEHTSVIGNVADKTDLLAINAAIEAARAGEYGEGFAVVATEIRKLSEHSKDAADTINDISTSSVNVAEKSGAVLSMLVPMIQNTAKLVQEICSTNAEQSSGIAQINDAIMQLTQLTQQYSSTSEELSASSEQLYSSSEELAKQVENLNELTAFFEVHEKGEAAILTAKSNESKSEVKEYNTSENETEPKPKGVNIDLSDNHDDDFERF